VQRIILLGLGHVCLVVGIAGVWLPLVPGVPLLLLAAFCYGKSSERFYWWLMNHKHLGPPIQAWQKSGSIPLRAKCVSVAMLATGMPFSIYIAPLLPIKIGLGVIAVGVAVFILTRPTTQPG
jgi:uncharacterized membrane protein YbaN (DUF454 family)